MAAIGEGEQDDVDFVDMDQLMHEMDMTDPDGFYLSQ